MLKIRALLIYSAACSFQGSFTFGYRKEHPVSVPFGLATDIIQPNLSTGSHIFLTAVSEFFLNLSELRLSTCSPSFHCTFPQIVTCEIYSRHSLIFCMIWKGESCIPKVSHFYWCQSHPTCSSYSIDPLPKGHPGLTSVLSVRIILYPKMVMVWRCDL
jgi:hypothetical protein